MTTLSLTKSIGTFKEKTPSIFEIVEIFELVTDIVANSRTSFVLVSTITPLYSLKSTPGTSCAITVGVTINKEKRKI